MTGRPRGSQARSGRLELRLTPDEEARLDRKRGTSTRSAYLRRFINDDLPPPVAETVLVPIPQGSTSPVVEQARPRSAPIQAPIQAPIHPQYATDSDGEPRKVEDTPLPAHRHKRQNEPYRYEQRGYSKTPYYHCTGWPDCDKELTG